MGPFLAVLSANMSYAEPDERRSHENVGPPAPQQEYTRDSREREFQRERPDEREERPGGDYDGPAGMQPEGIIESNWDEVCDNFDDMNLREELLRGIYAYGFEKPSAIQQRAILPCNKGLMSLPRPNQELARPPP